MHTRPALFESLETRRLMSATCGDVLAAETTSEPVALLLPAVQKVREAAVRMSVTADTDTLSAGTVSVTDGTSNTIFYAEKYQ